MVTLFEIITQNSTLDVQTGNTVWDHLNNVAQSGIGGGGPCSYVFPIVNEIDIVNSLTQVIVVEPTEISNIDIITTDPISIDIVNVDLEIDDTDQVINVIDIDKC